MSHYSDGREEWCAEINERARKALDTIAQREQEKLDNEHLEVLWQVTTEAKEKDDGR